MLPKQLKYGSKIESAAAKSFRSNIAPQNGTGPYNLGDTIIFNIPTRANLVMAPSESYLKWTVQNFSTAAPSAIRWDKCGSHGLIQRIRIYHGSNLIQDIDSYGMLAKMMFDLQSPTDVNYNKQNIMCGTRADLVVTTIGVGAVAAGNATPAILPITLQAKQITSGEGLVSTAYAPSYVTGVGDITQPVIYCLNLISLIGTLCPNNYLPLFAMTSAPLRVEIQLVFADVQAVNTITVTGHNNANGNNAGLVSNVEFIASMIELGDEAMQMIQSSLGDSPLQFVFGDYKNFQSSYSLTTASAPQITFPIPAKFSSLKSLFITQRDQGTGALSYFPFSSVNYGLQNYVFRVGPTIIPSKPVDDITSMFSELTKAIGSMSDLNFSPSIRKSSYITSLSLPNNLVLEANNASSVISGSFYIGLDLENYVNSHKDTFFAGWNSNTDDIYFIGNYNTNTVANGGTTNYSGAALPTSVIRYDAYAHFDSVIVFENGTCYVRY
jgi:hypothetical protein